MWGFIALGLVIVATIISMVTGGRTRISWGDGGMGHWDHSVDAGGEGSADPCDGGGDTGGGFCDGGGDAGGDSCGAE